jgi:hypothetical protein
MLAAAIVASVSGCLPKNTIVGTAPVADAMPPTNEYLEFLEGAELLRFYQHAPEISHYLSGTERPFTMDDADECKKILAYPAKIIGIYEILNLTCKEIRICFDAHINAEKYKPSIWNYDLGQQRVPENIHLRH